MSDDARGKSEESQILVEDLVLADRWAQLPSVVMFDSDLSAGAKLAYAALLYYKWRDGRFPGQQQMAADLGGGERTVRRYLADLESAGYIAVEQLGLGRPNRYIIRSLQERLSPGGARQDRLFPERPKMAGLGGQDRPVKAAKNGRSLIDQDSTTQTLSQMATAGELAGAFFSAIGETKTSKQRRERTSKIIGELLGEGFTPAVVEEACRLAGERGARGPDLLPHLVGEAHARTEKATRMAHEAHQEAIQSEATQAAAQEAHERDLAVLDALSDDRRSELEARARATLPGGGNGRVIPEPILRGAMIGLMRGEGAVRGGA